MRIRKGMLIAFHPDKRGKQCYVGRILSVNKRKDIVWVDWGNHRSLFRWQVYADVVDDRLTYLRCKAIGFWHYTMVK